MSKLKLISVTDTQFPVSLLEAISEQRNNGLFCDVTIIVQDRKFRAHKAMLSASSTYFRQLFSVAGQVIELNFVKADIFEEILNYIYTAKIHRIRSDKIEELISAGQVLGVKFIANLATPLSQVKGLPGLSKEGDPSGAQTADKIETGVEHMPIITESFTLSAEEFKMVSASIDREEQDDDVLFVAEVEAPTAQKNKQSEVIDLDEEPEPKKKKCTNEVELIAERDKAQHKESKLPSESELPKKLQENPETAALPVSPKNRSDVMVHDARSATQSTPSTPAHVIGFTPDPLKTATRPLEPSDVLGVQKKTVLLEQSPDRTSKIRLLDTRSVFSPNKDTGLDALTKTVTLDKAAEIDSLSSGCKVYANIGENTYDIVPLKEYSGEGEVRATDGRKSQTLVHSANNLISGVPRGKKKGKTEQEDHYELIMDGKTFYVCVVCKRPYVCMTSLRRHFNTHSWERKYPCRYCDKVFALAEYRTKHEITHTGERRYQCLLCNEMFLNYQLLSSHCKQMHNQDPSGRKEKDDANNNLYRLLPCKSVQFKPYSFVSGETGAIPIINENGIMQHVNPNSSHFRNQELQSCQSKMLNWDDLFVEPDDSHARPGAHLRPGPLPPPPPPPPPPSTVNQMTVANTTEFEFVIPETY